MATPRRLRFVHGVVGWLLATVVVLALLGSLELELFFVVSLIGFLVVVELTAPFNVTPRWRSRLKWIIALGLVAFGYVVIRRILEILPASVVEALLPFAVDASLVAGASLVADALLAAGASLAAGAPIAAGGPLAAAGVLP